MPKANAKDVYYFSHDCNARNDDKILAMRSVYGLEGYAMYFMIVEILREQQDYKLKITKYIWRTLSMQIGAGDEKIGAEKVKKFVDDCVNEFDLFIIEDGFLYTKSLIKRMNLFKEISEIRSEAAKKRWEKANGMQNECKSNANAMQNDANKNKLNQTKLKKNKKEDINNSDVTPDGDFKTDFPLSKSKMDF